MKSSKLIRKQLDRQLIHRKALSEFAEPRGGWIKLIRTALGMTTYQLARRIGVNQSRVVKMESAAADHSITLRSLERAAEALKCDLVFALIPKTNMEDILHQQAETIAKKQVHYVSHSMKLEDQAVNQHEIDEEVDELVEELMRGPEKRLWEDEE